MIAYINDLEKLEDPVRQILEAANRSVEAEAKENVHKIVNLFGERGDYRYKDLLGLVIGYSFRDRGITYIIDEAQSINPNLKFIIVCGENPGDDTRKRFPYGNRAIELYFEPGENPEYLARLNELISEILKAS